jgi:hypothetical protein
MDSNGAVTGEKHRCPNYNYRRPQSTATSTSTSTTIEAEAAAALMPSSVNREEQTVNHILQIVQRIERILSDATTPQT